MLAVINIIIAISNVQTARRLLLKKITMLTSAIKRAIYNAKEKYMPIKIPIIIKNNVLKKNLVLIFYEIEFIYSTGNFKS